MKRVLVLLYCVSFFPVVATASVWPLGDTSIRIHGARSQPYFIYVPDGKQFNKVRLRGRIVGAGHSNVLAVHLDGRLVKVLRPVDGYKLDVALPDLSTGFHRIVLTGTPTTRAPENQINVQCPPLYSLPMSVNDLHLNYIAIQMYVPSLANLPDGLYNRSFPSKKPLLGAVVLDPMSEASGTAALRLTSGLSANSGLRFTVGDNPQADFRIVLRHSPQAHTETMVLLQEPNPVRIKGKIVMQPRVPTLTIRYVDAASLDDAINGLLNKDYRMQLQGSQALVSGAVTEPQWGILNKPSTLAELGLSNITFTGDSKLELALVYPPYWQPTGPVEGQLMLRGQAGLPNDSHVNVWLDDVLSGSLPLENLASEKIEHAVDVKGRAPASTTIGLRLGVVLDHHAFCQMPAPGKLWVDAERSVLDLPHRNKAGIMQVQPKLVARPLIATDGTSAALDVALAIVQGENIVTGNMPLPYKVVHADKTGKNADASPITLRIATDSKALNIFVKAYAPQINPDYLGHTVWLHTNSGEPTEILADNNKTLRALAAVWQKVLMHIPDGALDVLVDTDSGQVLVLHSLPSTAAKPGGRLSNSQFELGMIIVAVLVLLFMILFFWLGRRRREAG